MTIPRLPGPLDFLTQGFGSGLQAYDQQRQQKYDQANSGARLILGLIQAGQLDPSMLSDPNMQAQLAAAKIPVPPQSAIVPSVAAEKSRQTVGQLQQVQPGSTKQALMLDIPTLGQISEDDLRSGLNGVKTAAMKDPAVARIMADVLTPDVAQNLERTRSASSAPKEYDYAAENFVAQAGLKMPRTKDGRIDASALAQQAKQFAAADPQYAQLVSSGQLSDEYFARAAAGFSRLDEEARIKWAEVAARREAAAREARYYYGLQDKSYDQDIQRLQGIINENKPQAFDDILLTGIQAKVQAGKPLDASEQAIMQRVQARQAATAEIQRLQGERGDLRDRSINDKNPVVPGQAVVPPSGAAAAQRRPGPAAPSGGTTAPAASDNVSKVRAALDAGQITEADVRASNLITAAEKAQILNERSTRKNPPRK